MESNELNKAKQITEDSARANSNAAAPGSSKQEKEPYTTKKDGARSVSVYSSDPRQNDLFRIDSGDEDMPANGNDDSSDSFHSVGWQCFRHVPYLTEEAKQNLRQYKYAGGDKGLMYVYFYNPLAMWLVARIPEWIAPNVITLLGFLFSAVPFVLIFVIFGTHFYNEEPASAKIPNWVFFAEAVSYFLYRMLDEMDGKQARRTGNSSPLGLIFDHGCDAFAVGLQCMILSKLIQTGPGGILFVHGSNAIFHFCTLEEYYVGGLFLPVGNAISDGSLLYFVVMLIPTIFGNGIFVVEVLPKNYLYEGSEPVPLMHLILIFVVTVQSITVIASVVNIFKHKRQVQELKQTLELSAEPIVDGEELDRKTLAGQAAAYFILQGSVQSLAFIGSKPLITNDGAPGEVSGLFLLMLTQCFLMQHLTCEVMLCHATKEKYVPYKNKLNVAMAALSLLVTSIWIVSPDFYERTVDLYTLLGIMLVLTVVCQWHFLLNTVSELAHALNISVFRVKEKPVALGGPVDKSALKEALLQKNKTL